MTLNDFFEQIQNQYQNELPFVVYRKHNGTHLKSILQTDTTLHEVVDFNESGFVFAPFNTNNKSVLIPLDEFQSIDLNSVTLGDSDSFIEMHPEFLKSIEEQKEFHLNLVHKAIKEISKGDLKKVVLSRHESLEISNRNSDAATIPLTIFKRLLDTYQSAFVYCWYHPKIGLWLGATPETLLKLEGNRLSTMSLAGTQPYIDTEDVVWRDKEKEEQQLVTDFIVESLQAAVSGDMDSVKSYSSSSGTIQVSETKTVRAGNLLHLKTDISTAFKPQSINLQQIVRNLHPTPAICGLPKTIAEQFIKENEGYDREYYTGFLGELNFKKKTSRNSNKRNVENNAYASVTKVSTLYVNLRCMQLKDDKAIIYVGGGITKDSSAESEWEETVSKSQVIKSVL